MTTAPVKLTENLRRRWLRGLATCLLAVAVSAPAGAQDTAEEPEDDPTWYQIEVLIYANDDPDAGDTESWAGEVELHYPQPIVRLSDTGYADPAPMATDTDNPGEMSAAATPGPAEQPFVKLPEDQRQLNAVAGQIARQRHFRPLFHQAWRQPAAGRSEANNIIVRGGKRYDQRYELEGSVKLSVERYLHFSTDLWLSSFVSAAGLEQMPWPKLPPLPIPSTASAPDSDGDTDWPGLMTPAFQPGATLLNLGDRQFIVDRTVVLDQSRRMRSGELHYIDHPLMGVVVQVTPYDPTPEPTEPETAETAAIQ